jgi:hypothetical protein
MIRSNRFVAEDDAKTIMYVLRRIERRYGRLAPWMVCEEARVNDVLAKYFSDNLNDENQARKIIQSVHSNASLPVNYCLS